MNDTSYRVTGSELRAFIERVERLDAEKADIADQRKEVMAEAKARGYDTKILAKIVAMRKRSKDALAEEDAASRRTIPGEAIRVVEKLTDG